MPSIEAINSPVAVYYIGCRPVIRISNGSLRLPVARIDLCLSQREMQHGLYQSTRSFSPIQRLHEKRTLGFFYLKLLKLFTWSLNDIRINSKYFNNEKNIVEKLRYLIRDRHFFIMDVFYILRYIQLAIHIKYSI